VAERQASLRSSSPAKQRQGVHNDDELPAAQQEEEPLHPPFPEAGKRTPAKNFEHPLLSAQACRAFAEHYVESAKKEPCVHGRGVTPQKAVERHKELSALGVFDSLSRKEEKQAFIGHVRQPGYVARLKAKARGNAGLGLGFEKSRLGNKRKQALLSNQL